MRRQTVTSIVLTNAIDKIPFVTLFSAALLLGRDRESSDHYKKSRPVLFGCGNIHNGMADFAAHRGVHRRMVGYEKV